MSGEPKIKYIDAAGNFVEVTDASVAYTVNSQAPDFLNFVEGVRKKAGNDSPVSDDAEKPKGKGRRK